MIVALIVILSVLAYIIGGVGTTRICRKRWPNDFNQGQTTDSIPAGLSFSFWWLIAVIGIGMEVWNLLKPLCIGDMKLPKRKVRGLNYKVIERLESQELPHLPAALRTAPPGVEFQQIWRPPYDGE